MGYRSTPCLFGMPSWVAGVQVYLNGELLPIKNFSEYVDMYLEDKSTPRVHERINDRWEIIAMASPGQFQQVHQPCHSGHDSDSLEY